MNLTAEIDSSVDDAVYFSGLGNDCNIHVNIAQNLDNLPEVYGGFGDLFTDFDYLAFHDVMKP